MIHYQSLSDIDFADTGPSLATTLRERPNLWSLFTHTKSRRLFEKESTDEVLMSAREHLQRTVRRRRTLNFDAEFKRHWQAAQNDDETKQEIDETTIHETM